MTKEELEEEAYQYDIEHLRGGKGARWYHNVTIRQAYLASAEPREKRISELEKENIELKKQIKDLEWQLQEVAKDNDIYQAENKRLEKESANLEAQIEKMKCCEMCKHKNLNWGFSPICEARDKIKIENPLTCKCDKWEIKEK